MLDLVAGWTGPIDEQLLADGAAADLTGCTVSLVLCRHDGSLLTLTGTVSITDYVNGKVRFEPAATDLVFAMRPYRARWMVTNILGRVVYFPDGEPEYWMVRQP